MKLKRPYSKLLVALPTVLVFLAIQAQADVIRVDMQPNAPFAGRPPVNFSGVESQAAAANGIFGTRGSNTWNELSITPNVAAVSPSFSNLVDSAGTATNVAISFTGTLFAADDGAVNNVGSNAVENDYFLTSTSVAYSITGLPANTQLALYLYAPNFVLYDSPDPVGEPSRGYFLTANGTTITVDSGPSDNALAYVKTSASGSISGTWSTAGMRATGLGFKSHIRSLCHLLPRLSQLAWHLRAEDSC